MKCRQCWFGLIAFGLLFSCLAQPARAEATKPGKFFLKNGQTVLFLGDSITYGDKYVQYIEAYLFTRFPGRRYQIFNRGIPSETCAGTSEPTHDPPRPDVHTRFDRTVLPLKPDVVTVCYGMNDGIYLAPNEPVFAKYRQGIKRLLSRIEQDAKARSVVFTPPPFDFRPHANKQRPAGLQPDYRFPDPAYDRTLAQFSEWLLTLRKRGQRVVDLHTPMSEHLAVRRKQDPQFYLAGDGIHPSPTGHWLMAQAILTAWNATADVADARVDAKRRKGSAGVASVETTGGELRFEWTLGLPMPLDPKWDAQSVALENVNRRLNRCRLTITGLPAEKSYELSADGKPLGTVSGKSLAAGVDMLQFSALPTIPAAANVLTLVQQRRSVLQEVWIKSDDHPRLAGTRKRLLKSSPATLEQAGELETQIRKLCQPRKLAMRVRAVEP